MKHLKVLASLLIALLLVFQCVAIAEPGWVEKDGTRYLYSDQDKPVSGWYLENDSWYCLSSEGSAITGIFNKGDGAYRTEDNGRVVEGWKKIENIWYTLMYFDDGSADSNKLRFLDSRDKKPGQEITVNGETIVVEGNTPALLSGWIPSEEQKTFYFNEDGTCNIGWKKIGEDLYFFTPDGLSTADKVFIDGEFYSFENGILKDDETKMAKALAQAIGADAAIEALATPTDLAEEKAEEIPEVTVSLITVTEIIPFETEYRKDYNRYEDEKTMVVKKGINGEKAVIYEVTTDKDGKEISRVYKEESVTVEPVNQIISVPKKPHVYEETEAIVEEAIPFTTEIQNDVSRVKGEPDKVVQEGKDGVKKKVYTVYLTDGVESGRVLKSESVINEPVKKIINVAIGDKVDVIVTYKTESEAIPYDTKTETTDELPKGETVVVQKGVNGEKETVYEIKTDLNGKQISKTVISEKVIKAPVTELVKVGTKEIPPATEPPTGFQD